MGKIFENIKFYEELCEKLPTVPEDKDNLSIDEVIESAKYHDYILLCLGENTYTENRERIDREQRK